MSFCHPRLLNRLCSFLFIYQIETPNSSQHKRAKFLLYFFFSFFFNFQVINILYKCLVLNKMVLSVSGKTILVFQGKKIKHYLCSDHVSIKHVSTNRYLSSKSECYEGGSYQQKVNIYRERE